MKKELIYKFLNNTNSTNDVARTLISSKEGKHGTVVFSDFQTNGRGRQNNKWESEKGKNLLASFIVEPKNIRPENQFVINQLISTVLCQIIENIVAKTPSLKQTVSIKWPNDIYIDNKKIAGILIEHLIIGQQIAYSIIGVGLNINQTEFQNAPNPISLKQITGKDFDIEKICQNIAEQLFEEFDHLDFCHLRSSYLKRLYRYNKKQCFSIDNKNMEATIVGVSEYGMLQLKFENGSIQEFELNSIKFII